MAYKLLKPYTEEQKKTFIIKYNHNIGLTIEDTPEALFALEDWEIIQDGEPIEDPAYYEKQKKAEKEHIAKLSMTKYDFFKYVCKPYNVSYPMLLQFVNSTDDTAAAWDLCARVYRGDELLCANITKFIPTITPEVLDAIFKEYGE